ncbi:MAG: anaerobic sulfatase maturase [candidate division KSB1 bacterium]|nr:anaerobic sulfatase maturase [candidate division KSB1 bacterium]
MQPSLSQKPLRSILVKPAGSVCNLACRYCFYLGKNISHKRNLPMRMSEETLRSLVKQMMRQGEREVSFCWQGGEPTLMGIEFYERAVEYQIRFGRPGQVVGNSLQTNGVLIDRDWALFLRDARFLVGLSIDGPQHIHDRYRVSKGQGSWASVMKALETLMRYEVPVNVLTVVNDYSVNFADEIYSFHKQNGLTYMQFIPCVERRRDDPQEYASFTVPAEAYGRFLCRLFDLWWDDFQDGKPTTIIRWFDSVAANCAGLEPPECTLQTECGSYLVAEHNGDVFSCDFFVDSGHYLGNLHKTPLFDLLNSPQQKSFGAAKVDLPSECRSCNWFYLCKGGCPKDRKGSGKEPRSNYLCGAYREFFRHAESRLKELAERAKPALR